VSLNFRLNWEGNFRSLEHEIEATLRNPESMASSIDEVVAKLREDRNVVRQFIDAYGRAPDRESVLDAIATYERSLATPGSRFDLWLAGDAGAITAEELSGYQLFKSFGCISCHQGVNVGGNLFQRHGHFPSFGLSGARIGARPQSAQRGDQGAIFSRRQCTDPAGRC
jgi:cytochrome c peroxidase